MAKAKQLQRQTQKLWLQMPPLLLLSVAVVSTDVPAVFGPHAGVVEAGRHRVGFDDLAVLVLHEVAAETMQHAGGAGGERRGVAAGGDVGAAGLDADQAHAVERDVGVDTG
jgi:hypothetical protein